MLLIKISYKLNTETCRVKPAREVKAHRVERRKSRVNCTALSSCGFFPGDIFFVQGRFSKFLGFSHENSVKRENYILTHVTLIKIYPILLLYY